MRLHKLTIGSLLTLGIFSACKKEPVAVPFTNPSPDTAAHYQLNILGKSNEKKKDAYSGARLFVTLNGITKVWLEEGAFGFREIGKLSDSNSILQLPAPDPDNNGLTNYSVFARPLATPGGRADIMVGATDTATGLIVRSRVFYAIRTTGTPDNVNISGTLLYLRTDLDGDGLAERYPLFHPRFKNYFLQYNNEGLKLLQARFFLEPTRVN